MASQLVVVDSAPGPRPDADGRMRWNPVALARWLCDIPSESGEERRIVDAIEALLRDAAPHLRVVRNGDALVARTELGRERRALLAGHVDTVPINGLLPVEERRDERTGGPALRGRGTTDMKSGVAVQLALALELVEPAVDVTYVWYDHEEVEDALNGLGRLVREHRDLLDADVAVLGEPTDGRVEVGCNGTLTARVALRGRRSHTARGWWGENAIHRLGALLSELHGFVAERPVVDGVEYREGIQAVRCRGGVASNVVPDYAELELNFRFAPNRTPEGAADYLREICGDADEFEVLDVAPGALPGLQAAAARELVAAFDLPVRAKLGWTDVSRLSRLGIPAINFGPGDPLLAHTDVEEVRIAQIEDCWLRQRAWLVGESA